MALMSDDSGTAFILSTSVTNLLVVGKLDSRSREVTSHLFHFSTNHLYRESLSSLLVIPGTLFLNLLISSPRTQLSTATLRLKRLRARRYDTIRYDLLHLFCDSGKKGQDQINRCI